MIGKPVEFPTVSLSVRVYQALLLAYPTKFQQEYGSDMVQVFRDCCLWTVHQGGTNGMAKLWAVTLFDLIQSVVSEHRQKETEMKKEMKPEDIRMAGWAFILGGIAFAISLLAGFWGPKAWFVITILLSYICLPLLALGMLGLRSHYAHKVGGFGKSVLLFGAIFGPTISIVGTFLQGVGEFWSLIFIGACIQFACLVLFGLIGIFTQPLPHWNILPIIAGLWFTVRFLNNMIAGFPDEGDPTILDATFIIIQSASMIALGYILKSDVPEEMVATA